MHPLERLRTRRSPREEPRPLPRRSDYERILVPMKLGDIGEEMVATAIALAKDDPAEVQAITVVRVPLRFPLEGELPPDVAARVDASLEEARALGEDHEVEVATGVVRARSIGHAIVEEAKTRRGGPDRARLVGALAAAVALLLPDGRLRAPACAM